jgi:hypothetical protein
MNFVHAHRGKSIFRSATKLSQPLQTIFFGRQALEIRLNTIGLVRFWLIKNNTFFNFSPAIDILGYVPENNVLNPQEHNTCPHFLPISVSTGRKPRPLLAEFVNHGTEGVNIVERAN